MTVEDHEIKVAHRAKGKRGLKPRSMIVRCGFSLREHIFAYTKNLKDCKNADGDYYSTSKQLPEPLYTQKRERDQKIKEVKCQNAEIPNDQKHRHTEIKVKDNTLYLNKVPQKKHLHPPTVKDMLNVNPESREKIENLQTFHSVAINDKGSIFRGHAVHVKSSQEVKLAYNRIRLLYPESDHVMVAYHIKSHWGYHDHGEHGAGVKLQKILENRSINNIAVFVTREYGGIHLGPRHFLHIEKVTREALNEMTSD